MPSPYNWQSHNPKIQIPRPDVRRVADLLRENGSAVVMGGRGMGKSVFLGQVKTELAEKGKPSAQPPGRGFFNDLEASRRSLERLGLLATGSIGIFIVRDILGSSFLARALHLRLRPLDRNEVEILASPFGDRGTPLSDDLLDALVLASGGVPALLTYGFQGLWNLSREVKPNFLTPDAVTAIYKVFRVEHIEYLRDLMRALQDPEFSEAPRRIWERIQAGGGRIEQSELEKALGTSSGALDLDVPDCLHLLEAVGVVRLESSTVLDDPITAHPIASLLNLPKASAPNGDLRPETSPLVPSSN